MGRGNCRLTPEFTLLPLPYCVYIAIVNRVPGFCCEQIKNFVDSFNLTLKIFFFRNYAEVPKAIYDIEYLISRVNY